MYAGVICFHSTDNLSESISTEKKCSCRIFTSLTSKSIERTWQKQHILQCKRGVDDGNTENQSFKCKWEKKKGDNSIKKKSENIYISGKVFVIYLSTFQTRKISTSRQTLFWLLLFYVLCCFSNACCRWRSICCECNDAHARAFIVKC